MLHKPSAHLRAVLQALLVTVLWSTSWVLMKFGLEELPALTFAGLRYGLAFLCLLPFVLRGQHRTAIQALTRRQWMWLIFLGLLFYTFTQGAIFTALVFLPAVNLSLLLNFSAVVVALLGILFLSERPTILQWGGVGLFLIGVVIYFYPAVFPADRIIGLLIAGVAVLANAGSAVLGRYVNREQNLSPLIVTVISMGIGAGVLLTTGIILQGLPTLTIAHGLIIFWLALVNTAFAFTLWNHTLQSLSAVESSIINNTMLVQIAFLAWVFLGEQISGREIVGLVLAMVGILIVQLRR